MNVLLLSNSAPGYHRFFNGLARRLAADGHSVQVAVDCPYSADLNGLQALGFPVHDFAAHFRRGDDDPAICERYRDFNLNAALLSDFERAEVYGIGGRRDAAWWRRLQAALLGFFERILQRGGIDLVLYENVSNAFAHYALLVSRRLGVAYCGLVGSRLPGRYALVADPCAEHLNYQPTVEAILAGRTQVPADVRDWCADYLRRLEEIVPDYMKFNRLDQVRVAPRYLNRAKLTKLGRVLRHLRDDHRHAFQVGNPLLLSWRMVARNVARRLRLAACRRHYSAPVAGERFLLYPLHYHPESSTSILSGTHLDEYEVIRNIAFSLPAGHWLYVKDHVSAFGYPALAFYRRLAALPNVRLLSPFEPTKQLIRASRAVITLTSTVGYEALLLGKRVFLYGSVFYQFHPNVERVAEPARLFELFADRLDAPLAAGADYNEAFVAAYYLNTWPGVLNFFLDDARTEALLDAVWPQLRAALAARVAAGKAHAPLPASLPEAA